MKAGIVGLPNVGKSTLFNALTAAGAEASNYPFCTIEPNVGMVQVPDPRLARINHFIPTQRIVPAILQLVDIAGLVRGASKGEGLGNKFLSHIREVDAVLHVVRCFDNEDITHVDGRLDPVRDIETIETELMLADLDIVESTLDKAIRTARTGDKEAKFRADLMERCRAALADGRALRTLAFNADEARAVRGLGLLTAKPVLYIANVAEADLGAGSSRVAEVERFAAAQGGAVVPVCARIEAELNELPEADRKEMLDSLGMAEPALNIVARAAYKLLGLQSYFTAGPKEIRAWTIKVGATAPEAAAAIHTDFERGFIRVEVYSLEDLEAHGTEASIKSAGRMRTEGKAYLVKDGDICHFLFNV